MRIMFVAPFGMGRKTTVWARTLPLAAELAALGHTVRILVPPWDSPEEACTVLHHRRVTIQRVTVRGGLVLIVARMLWAIRAFQPEVLHFVKPRAYSGICQWLVHQSRILSQMSSSLLLLDADDWEQAWNHQLATRPWVSWFLAWQEEWGLRHAQGVTVASQWLGRRVRAYAPELPCLYLPNGATLPSAIPTGPRQGPPTVLWFTRFVEIDPAWMTKFWSELQAQVPECQLLVAGAPVESGLEKAFQEALMPQTQERAHVEWLGYVEPATLPDLYDRAHCAIVPARESAANLAKCSMRMLDVIANGMPCVASRVGEQARFGDLSQVTLLDATVTSSMFVAAVVARLHHPGTPGSQNARDMRVPTWPVLARYLDHFYRTLGQQGSP